MHDPNPLFRYSENLVSVLRAKGVDVTSSVCVTGTGGYGGDSRRPFPYQRVVLAIWMHCKSLFYTSLALPVL